jgi:hypothetical protein
MKSRMPWIPIVNSEPMRKYADTNPPTCFDKRAGLAGNGNSYYAPCGFGGRDSYRDWFSGEREVPSYGPAGFRSWVVSGALPSPEGRACQPIRPLPGLYG